MQPSKETPKGFVPFTPAEPVKHAVDCTRDAFKERKLPPGGADYVARSAEMSR